MEKIGARPGMPRLQEVDFERAPFVAIWEITRACDLACRHCRAEAQPEALPGELDTREGFRLLEQLASMGTPICVLSGGDPAKRADLPDLVSHGARLGMRMATIPAATARLTRTLVEELKCAGLSQMALSLDGSSADLHDAFRKTPGAFDHVLEGAGFAREVELPLQINTTFSGCNLDDFDALADWVGRLEAVFWEVFLLVPTGRGRDLAQMNAAEFERLFGRLARIARTQPFVVKVTEAPHYRRFLMQSGGLSRSMGAHPGGVGRQEAPAGTPGRLPPELVRDFGPGGTIGLAPKGVNAGNGHLFVNYRGDILPSGFLPLTCGNVRWHTLQEIYQTHPVFRQLRDPDLLRGKCRVCDYRRICGGSRARAYAMTGDYLAEEPFCAYVPPPAAVGRSGST